MIKYVFTDVDDTFLDFSLSGEFAIKKMFEEHGFEHKEDAYKAFLKIGTPLWNMVTEKKINIARLQELRWPGIFAELNIDYDKSIDYEMEYRNHLAKTVFKIEGAEEYLKYLSEKYILCAATNSYYFQQKSRFDIAGFTKYFTHIFASHELGAEKPYAEFFERCLEKAGCRDKSEVIMIGDSLSADVRGAKEVGIKTIWFNRHGIDCDSGADYVINHLTDIKNIL